MSIDEDALSRLLALEVLVHPGSTEHVTHGSWLQLQRTPEGVPLLLRSRAAEYLDAVGSDWSADLSMAGAMSPAACRHLGHYTRQCDPDETGAVAMRAAVGRLLRAHVPVEVPLAVELGCSTGPDVASMATVASTVLAVDAYVVPLRWLARRLAAEPAPYIERVRGDQYTFGGLAGAASEQTRLAVVPVCANALDPPLKAACADVVVALNTLDSVVSPLTLLGQIDAILKPGGIVVLSSPFHWRDEVTPPQEQLLADYPHLSGPEAMAEIMAGRHPEMPQIDWEWLETDEVDWLLRDHQRCATRYDVWLCVARKAGRPA